jgi:hypothetical protein
VHTGGDASAVIPYTDGIVFQDLDVHVRAEAGHGFVDTVVYYFVYQVVKASFSNVSDVHGGALSYGLQALQDLNATGGILLLGNAGFFVFYHLFLSILS